MDKAKQSVWKWYEIVFLCFSFVALIVCFFVAENKNFLALISSIATVFYVATAAKGVFWSPFANIVCLVFYIWVSTTQGFWGEVIRDACILLPIAIIACFRWVKNRDKHNTQIVRVREIKWQEYLISFAVCAVGAVGVYFLLDYLGTNQVILNTITFSLAVLATYLLYRRCQWYAILFLVNNVVTIVLWAFTMESAGLEFLSVMVSYVILFVLNLYGLFVWHHNARTQRSQAATDRKARYARALERNKQSSKIRF